MSMSRVRKPAMSLAALLLAAATMVLTIGVRAPAAYAWASEGCKWSSATVYYTNDLKSTSSYHSLVGTAASDWTATPTPIYVYEGGPNWDIAAYNEGNSGYDGTTSWSCNSSHHFTNVLSYWNTYLTNGYSTNGRVQVMVHEMGHGLGLAHAGSSSCSGQPIMYYSSDRYFVCNHIRPQTDDINGINALY